MVDAQENPSFSSKKQDFERERGNQSIGACPPLSLSIFFFSSLLKFPFRLFFLTVSFS